VDESQRWTEFGHWLVEQRERLGLKRRDAARRAKIAESAWRDLETGRKDSIGGIRVLPSLSAEVIERMAAALEVSPEEVLERVGRPPRVSANSSSPAGPGSLSIVEKLARLSIRDRRLVERIVDGMLEES
jgi:transcriptional regulator with XRE-family HTH domain